LNDDGILDLVVVNSGSPSDDERVGVFFGIGDGTFEAPAWDKRLAEDAFLTDSDNDGVMDAWVESPKLIDAHPFNMADWNGDGALDVAVVIQDGHAAYILRGNEEGTFEGDLSSILDGEPPGLWAPFPLTIADATGDGVPDLLLPTTNNSVLVGEGTGDGRFISGDEYAVKDVPTKVFAADLNGDGRVDLLTTNSDPFAGDKSGASISILIADEDRSYKRTDYPFEGSWLALAIGDLDGNGTLDLVCVPSFQGMLTEMKVLIGTGDGTFTPGVDHSFGYALLPQLRDFNGDGILDVVAMSFNEVYFMLGRGEGTFEPGVSVATRELVALEDLDEDGVLDAIKIGTDESNFPTWLTVAPGNGAGSFGPERREVPLHFSPQAVARDVDADGHIDLVLDDWILRGMGDGSFSCGEYRLLKSSLVADLNNDGLEDVVRWVPGESDNSTRVQVFLGESE